jgi:hypothetical protein
MRFEPIPLAWKPIHTTTRIFELAMKILRLKDPFVIQR